MESTTSEHVGNILEKVFKLPLQVTVDKQLISYWLRLLNKDESTLALIIYIIVLNLFVRDEYKVKWLCRVKTLSTVVDYLICGLIKTKLILNSLNKYYIIELKILLCKIGIPMFSHPQCVQYIDDLRSNWILKTI